MSVTSLAVGMILVVASVWWIAQGSEKYLGAAHGGLEDLITVLNGLIPFMLFIMGLFVVWLELDELKAGKKSR